MAMRRRRRGLSPRDRLDASLGFNGIETRAKELATAVRPISSAFSAV